jgi:hypothetical protein
VGENVDKRSREREEREREEIRKVKKGEREREKVDTGYAQTLFLPSP